MIVFWLELMEKSETFGILELLELSSAKQSAVFNIVKLLIKRKSDRDLNPQTAFMGCCLFQFTAEVSPGNLLEFQSFSPDMT